MKKKPLPQPDPYPIVIEQFSRPHISECDAWTRPSCFNGIVNVHRYRITIEKLDEPIDVIRERISRLWEESDNFHHRGPLRVEAAKVGLTLDADRLGKKKPAK